jgi:hypothetical protein
MWRSLLLPFSSVHGSNLSHPFWQHPSIFPTGLLPVKPPQESLVHTTWPPHFCAFRHKKVYSARAIYSLLISSLCLILHTPMVCACPSIFLKIFVWKESVILIDVFLG